MGKKIKTVLAMVIMAVSIGGCHGEDRTNEKQAQVSDKREGIDIKIAFWGASGEEDALKKAAEGMTEEIEGIRSVE